MQRLSGRRGGRPPRSGRLSGRQAERCVHGRVQGNARAPVLQHKETCSFQVATDDQAETDHLWSAIIDNGGQVSAYGWCRGEWGVSW